MYCAENELSQNISSKTRLVKTNVETELSTCILCTNVGINALLQEGICAASPYISHITTGLLDL